MGTRLEFRILGPLEVLADGQPVAIAGPRQRTVLAMLLTAPDRVVSVEALAEAVWEDRPPVTGRTQVAISVAGLRKSFRAAGCDDEVVATAPPGYRLVLGPHQLDAADFRSLVQRARQAAGRGHTRQAARLFAHALEHWRGPALDDARSQLVRAAGAAWDEERLSACDQHTALRLELGEHQQLVGELTDTVRAQPLREQPRAQLMLAYYRCGRRAEALEVFHDGRRRLVTELGLEPGPALRELHRAVLRDDPCLRYVPGAAQAPFDPAADLADLARLLDERLESSYRALPPDAARLYRRLALLGAAGADAASGAALLGTGPAQAERVLQRLVDAQLVDAAGPAADGRPRFRLSGMRRLYALARARADDPPGELQAARARLNRRVAT